MSTRVLVRAQQQPAVLLAALAAAGLAAVLLAAGAVVPVVEGAARGFGSAPLLIVLALLPVVLAAAAAARGRHASAAGVLAGAAALAPGRAVLDLQFAADPSVAVRPELYLPADLLEHSAASGLWFLLGGQVAALVAGALAVRAYRLAEDRDDSEEDGAVRWRQRWLLVVVVAAGIAAIGVLMAPFSSADVYLLARNAFEGPAVALTGYLLIGCALPLAAALVVTSGNGEFARGGLAGLAAAALALALPGLIAGMTVDGLSVTAGPIVALAGVAGLVAVVSTRPAAEAPDEPTAHEAGEVSVPGRRRLLVATGLLAVLTAAAAVLGSVTPQLTVAGSLPAPESPARWVLLVAGLLVGFLGLATFVPPAAAVLRPVLSIAWAGVLLAGAAVLDTAITATGVTGAVSAGPGVLWTWLAMCGAVVTACCSVVVGIVEREDADDIGDIDAAGAALPGLQLVVPLTAGAVLAIAAFGTPVVEAPDYVPAGLWSDFGTPSWGLLAALLTLLGAVALAPRSRPLPAAGVLAGAVCLLALHAAALPLSAGDIDGASAGIGLWFSVAGIVALASAAGIALADHRRSRG
ncbi:hypothetical protein ABZ863_00005 [Saccharomonospora sp. NPDC046836]|uniref:hypothetical protein n=1 Tax=Saccharomonospora sp. NPDC046836 TaxID=3156921 RepID=UPI0033F2F6F5